MSTRSDILLGVYWAEYYFYIYLNFIGIMSLVEFDLYFIGEEMGYDPDLVNLIEKRIFLKKCQKEAENFEKRRDFFSKNSDAAEVNSKMLKFISNTFADVFNKNFKKKIKFQEQYNKFKLSLNEILRRKGLPSDFLDIKYDCGFCNDSGKINGGLCKCAVSLIKKESIERLCNDCALSDVSLKSISFDSFSLDFYPTENKERDIMRGVFGFCKSYARDFDLSSNSLIFVGATGLGKTHLSISILKHIIKKGFNGVYVSSPNIVQTVRKNKFIGESIFSVDESKLSGCDLLIIDDLGMEFNSKFSTSVVYNLINSRILKSLPTILSTNLYMKEMETNYNAGLVSRIIGNFKRLGFVGNDIRQAKIL